MEERKELVGKTKSLFQGHAGLPGGREEVVEMTGGWLVPPAESSPQNAGERGQTLGWGRGY